MSSLYKTKIKNYKRTNKSAVVMLILIYTYSIQPRTSFGNQVLD